MADDELARTATAPAAGGRGSGTIVPGATLGRYRIDRELGTGGMGVVYAAFDPDLERKIALKILRVVDTGEARQRLLREARAMARLRHPNVVVVYEVGSADGLDFVAMELVEAGSLADWLKEGTRDTRHVLDAFFAAGRGLAAAHAAGIVHRDFKPHNILRGKDGRILVTDFGLARDATNPLETTLPTGELLHSSLSGITVTGAVVGTPAYMAPEQWLGGSVGPAADQFAFCVALWEALAGKRPFRGTTAEQMRDLVARGPASLDDSKLPRHVRAPLRRGLSPDPDARWPSMTALIDALSRRTDPRVLSVGGIAVACAGALALLLFNQHGDNPATTGDCVSARAMANVWGPQARAALLGSGRSGLVPLFEADATAWRDVRDEVCSAPADPARTACLEGVVARFDAVRQAVDGLTGEVDADGVASQLVDAHACAGDAPRLALHATPDAIAALRLAIRADAASGLAPIAAELAGRGNVDPCVRAVATIAEHDATEAYAARVRLAREAVTAADRCSDERVRADAQLRVVRSLEQTGDAPADAKEAIERASAAVERVPQDDLHARVDIARARLAYLDGKLDSAIELATGAADAFAKRGLPHAQARAMALAVDLRLGRGTRADLEAVRTLTTKWRPIAQDGHFEDADTALARDQAYAQFYLGDTIDAHATLVGLWHADPWQPGLTQIKGKVVDSSGKPVANAQVAVASRLYVDARGPLPWELTEPLHLATADEHGEFVVGRSPGDNAAIAIHGSDRATPVPVTDAPLVLVIGPTRRIDGRIAGKVPSKTYVAVAPRGLATSLFVMAPVAEDGTFSIAGAPQTELELGTYMLDRTGGTIQHATIPAGKDTVRDVVLQVEVGNRALDVAVMSTVDAELTWAFVFAAPGHHAIASVADLHGVASAQTRFAVRQKRGGPLVARFDALAAGELTVCAIGLSGNLMDPHVQSAINLHFKELDLRCTFVEPGAATTLVETPPQKRYD